MDRITEAYNGAMGEEMKTVSRERIHWVSSQVCGQNVLDIGCSQGICDILLGREGFRVLGVDSDTEAIEYAVNSLEHESENTRKLVHFVVGTVPGFDFGEEKFDSVILSEILEHLIQPEQMVDLVKSILRPDGRIIITVPYGLNPYPDHKRTFYLSNLLELLTKDFRIDSYKYFNTNNSCWLGVVALMSEKPGVDDELFYQAVIEGEKCFEKMETARFQLGDIAQEKTNDYKQKISALNERIAALNSELTNVNDNYLKMKQWNDDSQKTIEDRDKQITALKEQSEGYLNKYQQAKQLNDDRKQTIEDRDRRIAVLKEQSEGYQNKYQQAKQWNDENQKKIEDRDRQITVLKQWNDDKLKKIEDRDRQISSLKQWNEDKQKKIEERDRQITAQKEQSERFLNNYQQAKLWNENNLKKVEDRDRQIAALKEQSEGYLNNYQQAKLWNDDRQKKIEELNKQVVASRKKIADLKTQLLDDNYEIKKMKEDFINFEINNANRIQRLMNDNKIKMENLDKANKNPQSNGNVYKLEQIPEVFQFMAASRVGRIMAKIFLVYHNMRTR